MVSPPSIATFACPTCSGSFAVHTFFSDFAGEAHRSGRCPWCGTLGTVPTGTVAEPAMFHLVGPASHHGSFERAVTSQCPACQTFIVDDDMDCGRCGARVRSEPPAPRDEELPERASWLDRLTSRRGFRVGFADRDWSLEIDGRGEATLRTVPATSYRGVPAPPGQPLVYQGRLDPLRVRRIASLVIEGGIPPPVVSSLLPDEAPASLSLAHGDERLGVCVTHETATAVPAIFEARTMMRSVVAELARTLASVDCTPPEQIDRKRGRARAVEAPRTAPVAPPPPDEASARPPTSSSSSASDDDVAVTIPPSECVTCDVDAPFVGRVEQQGTQLYATYRCPACRCEFKVYTRALQPALWAWLERR